jgi:glutamate synthase (NADPH/NADH) large chain
VASAARQDAAGRPRGRPLIPDDEIKAELAKSHPYRKWLDNTQIVLEEMADAPAKAARSNLSLLDRQQAFGYSQEDLSVLMTPMASTGEEAAGSMGTDTPLSALSNKPKSLFTYFKQNFAQVTNPPIDPIREELVMSLVSIIGPRPNLFDIEGLSKTKRLEVRQPILTDADLEKIRSISDVADNHFKSRTLDTTFHAGLGASGMEQVLEELCGRAEARCAKASTSSSCRTAPPEATAFRFRRCWRPPPCIIT